MKPSPLGQFSIEEFLAKYWQKQPLLIRSALPNISSPVSADELAGLACENGIESRLISNYNQSWQLEHGPFNATKFSLLPKTHWTLLVQAVDHYIPAAASLLEMFDFIPRWRLDDLMVSYAAQEASVGAHFDNYDVFLIQTQGQRLWHIGGKYDDNSPLEEELPVKIIKHFESEHSWLVNPGDIVYLPPGIGHHGISQSNDCMTCSVGFRAPSYAEILSEYCDHIINQLSEADRYVDAELKLQQNSGEIKLTSLTKIETIISQHMLNPDTIHEWFGCHVTSPKYETSNEAELTLAEHDYTLNNLDQYLVENNFLFKNESTRFAFFITNNVHKFFADGQLVNTVDANSELIELLCNKSRINPTDFTLHNDNKKLLLKLLKCGSLYLQDNDK